MRSNYLVRWRGFIPAYCFSLLICVMASLPGDGLERAQRLPESPLLKIIPSDPFMHFLVFGLLTLFICRGFNRKSGRSIETGHTYFARLLSPTLWDDRPGGESGHPGRLHVFGLGERYVAICFSLDNVVT